MNKEIFLNRITCPLCSCNKYTIVHTINYSNCNIKQYMLEEYSGNYNHNLLEDSKFEILKCSICDFIYQRNIINDNYLNVLYDEWTNQDEAFNDHKINGGWKKMYNQKILQSISKKICKDIKDIKFLDYGAGFGESLLVANAMGLITYSFEPFNSRSSFLNENNIDTINNNTNLKFDIIFLDQVLEHCNNPNEILLTIYNLLEPNGILYLAVPNRFLFQFRISRLNINSRYNEFNKVYKKLFIGPYSHINFFSHKNLLLICKKNGFVRYFPINSIFLKPISLKNILRVFYHYLFSTVFYLKKKN